MASGATLVAPKGWSVDAAGDVVTLVDPERAVTLFVVERPEHDALAAIPAAWRRVRPGFAPTVEGEADAPPPSGGWDATLSVRHAAPAHRAVAATARRWGGRTWVALVDGDRPAMDRRGAQIETAIGSVRPRGMEPESLVGRPLRRLDGAALDAFLDEARARLAVPGAVVAVVRGREVIYERALGVREIGKPERVGASTRFLVGSVTKPMTTLMQAALVDAKVLTWETPVTTLLPSFALGDPDVTRKVAVWHTSCACTGMPRRDAEYLFEWANVSPEARVASMRAMKPTTGFGETFQYSNLMVAAGGFAAAHAYAPERSLADAYAAAMRDEVFGPLGMAATTLDFDVVARGDHAAPHALAIDGATRALPLALEKNVLPIAPAGAVWTTMADLERYALAELGRGVTPEGRRIVSESSYAERRRVRVRSGADDGYGLGLDVSKLAGLEAVGHDGGAFGYGSTMLLLPERDVAVLVLTNVRNGGGYEQLPFNRVAVRKVVELLFPGAKDVAAQTLAYLVDARRRSTASGLAGVERAPDAAWLTRLAGAYSHPSLGRVDVRGAVFDAGEWRTTFGRRARGGADELVFLDPPFAGVAITALGDPPRLVLDAGQETYELARTSDARAARMPAGTRADCREDDVASLSGSAELVTSMRVMTATSGTAIVSHRPMPARTSVAWALAAVSQRARQRVSSST